MVAVYHDNRGEVGDPVSTPRSSDAMTDLEAQKKPFNPSPRGPPSPRQAKRRLTSNRSPDNPRKRTSISDVGIKDAEYLELDEDVYSAVIFTLTADVSELYSNIDQDGLDTKVNAYRALFTLTLLGFNYALQIGLLVWVYFYVAAPALHRAQTVYRRYHAEVFSDGEFQRDLWENWAHQEALCRIAFSNYWFLYAILSLWWVAMVTEVNKTYQVFAKINSLQHTDDPSEMIIRREATDGGERENLVWQLPRSVRVACILLIFVPKLAIAAGLWWVGTLWLAATDSFENLVLNSVALTFIINIDEQIFAGLIPATMKENIKITKLVRSTTPEDSEHESDVKAAYRSATFHLALVIFGVAAYMSAYGQSIPYLGIFPGYAYDNDFACPALWDRQRSLVCLSGKDCFPLG